MILVIIYCIFLSSKCTSDAMFAVLHQVYQALQSNLYAVLVLYDYAKVSYCGNQDILIKMQYFYGIRGISLNWFNLA